MSESKRGYFIGIFIGAAVLLALIASVADLGIGDTASHFFKDYEEEEIFVSLDENYNALTYGVAIFTVKNPTDKSIDLKNLLGLRFIEEKNRISSYELFIEEEVLKTYETAERICDKTAKVKNATFDGEAPACTDVKKTGSYTTKEWVPLSSAQAKPQGWSGRVMVKAYFSKPSSKENAVSIDWVPSVTLDAKYEKPEWAWWNASWQYSKNITVTPTTGLQDNVTIHLDKTQFGTDWCGIAMTDGAGASETEKSIDCCHPNFPNDCVFNVGSSDINASTSWTVFYGNTTAAYPRIYASDRHKRWDEIFAKGEDFEDVAEGSTIITTSGLMYKDYIVGGNEAYLIASKPSVGGANGSLMAMNTSDTTKNVRVAMHSPLAIDYRDANITAMIYSDDSADGFREILLGSTAPTATYYGDRGSNSFWQYNSGNSNLTMNAGWSEVKLEIANYDGAKVHMYVNGEAYYGAATLDYGATQFVGLALNDLDGNAHHQLIDNIMVEIYAEPHSVTYGTEQSNGATNNIPQVSGIAYNTTNGSTTNFLYNQYIDRIGFNCSDLDSDVVSASVTVTMPSGGLKLDNASAANYTDELFQYVDDFQLNAAGTWTINASCVDDDGASASATSSFDVIKQNSSTKDGWYGYRLDNATTSDLTTNYDYGVDLFELNYSISSQLRDEWNTSNIKRINESYDLNVRVGLNLVFDYAYSEANVQLAKERINDTLVDLTGDPYSTTVEYISFETFDGVADADRAAILNNLSESAVDATDNRFIVYSTNFNSSAMDSAYVEATPMVYIQPLTEAGWVYDEAMTMRTNASLNRIYYNIASADLKVRIQDFQENVLNIIRGTPVATAITADNLTAQLSNGDIVVFNNESSAAKVEVDASSIAAIVNKDVWDVTNKELYELDTDGKFGVNVSAYNATVIYFEDVSSIRLDSSQGKAFIYSGGSSSTETFAYSNAAGTNYDNFALSGAVDVKAELFDPHYEKNNFLTYYGQLDSAYINFTSPDIEDYEIVIVANQSYDWEVLNYSATDWYGYISVADYADTDVWENGKKAEVDDWLDNNNESFRIFIDGLDTGIGGVGFSARFKRVVDYAQVTRNVDVVLNTYTAYQDFATWGRGGVMKESCVNRWNGASAANPDNYSREDWSLELNKSIWYQSHNIKVFCQSFDSRDAGANLYYVANSTELMSIYFASKVLGYDYFYLSQPDFNYVASLYVYDVGADLQNGYSVTGDDLYYRRYSNGIVYYNSTSGEGWFEDGRQVNSVEMCFDLYKPNTNPGGKTVEFTINKDAAANVNGDYSISLDGLPADTWTTTCISLNETDISNASGRYIVEAWVMPRSTTPGQGCNLANILKDGAGKHSWWDTSATDSFTAYGLGQNWKINVTVNETKTTSFDSMTSISETLANASEYYNITLSTPTHYPVEVWSSAIGFAGTSYKNLTYLHTDGLYYGLNPQNTSTCDSNNPAFSTATVDAETFKSCYEESGSDLIIRVAAPSLSDRLFQLNGGVETDAPEIALISPANASTVATESVNFTYNVSDESLLSECSLIISGSVNLTDNSTVTNATLSFAAPLTNAEYEWSVNCTDEFLNVNNSETWKVTVNYAPPVPPLGGSGGGGGSACQPVGYSCSVASDCCQGYCVSGKCSLTPAEGEQALPGDGTKTKIVTAEEGWLSKVFDWFAEKLGLGDSEAQAQPGIMITENRPTVEEQQVFDLQKWGLIAGGVIAGVVVLYFFGGAILSFAMSAILTIVSFGVVGLAVIVVLIILALMWYYGVYL